MQKVAWLFVRKQTIQTNKSIEPFNLLQGLAAGPRTIQMCIELTLDALVKIYGFTLLLACQCHLGVVVLFLALDWLQT
jgi:hypothetical protein